MRIAIIKVERMPTGSGNYWLGVIKALQDSKHTVQRDFAKKADLNVVLSGAFENPRGYSGKRVMILNRHDWLPFSLDAWGGMYRDIIKHYYDDIVDVTEMLPSVAAERIAAYIDAEKRQADKS